MVATRGFSILEVLMVIGLISLLASLTLGESIGEFSRLIEHNEVEEVIRTIREARINALYGACHVEGCEEVVHGIPVTYSPQGTLPQETELTDSPIRLHAAGGISP